MDGNIGKRFRNLKELHHNYDMIPAGTEFRVVIKTLTGYTLEGTDSRTGRPIILQHIALKYFEEVV